MLTRGDQLTRRQRDEALAMFVHRNTFEHPFPASHSGRAPAESDSDWLAAHAFHVRKDGRLMLRNAQPACMAAQTAVAR